MARVIDALTHATIVGLEPGVKPYKKFDGRGLYVRVNPNGSKLWRLDFDYAGKEYTLALGEFPATGLAAARALRDEARVKLDKGINPCAERKAEKEANKEKAAAAAPKAEASGPTFKAVAEDYCKMMESPDGKNPAEWSADHAKDVRSLIENHINPSIGAMPIADVRTGHVRELLEAIDSNGLRWFVRERISMILCQAVSDELIEFDVAQPLKKNRKMGKRNSKNRYASLKAEQLPNFLTALADHDDTTAKALTTLLALTFVRTNELRSAEWAHVDFEGGRFVPAEMGPVLLIPGANMKKTRSGSLDHLVPLAPQAVGLLKWLLERRVEGCPYVFPGERRRKGQKLGPQHDSAVLYVLETIGYKGAMTGHGFRHLASTLMNEQHGGFAESVIEAQLAHVKVGVAGRYNRAEYLEQRVKLMREWANLLDQYRARGEGRNVIELARAA